MAEQTQTGKLKDMLTLLSDECYSQELSACSKHPIFQPGKFINLILALPEVLIKDPDQSLDNFIKIVGKRYPEFLDVIVKEHWVKVLPKEENEYGVDEDYEAMMADIGGKPTSE